MTEELRVVESDVSARATELTLKLIKARGSQAGPIPLAQRLCLLGAAKRVERVGSDAGAVLGPGVIPIQEPCRE